MVGVSRSMGVPLKEIVGPLPPLSLAYNVNGSAL